MRGILAFSMVALSAVMLAGDAQAQRGGGGGFGGRGGFGGGMGGGGIQKVALLRLESVQDELGVDESQLEQVQALRGGRGERGGRGGQGGAERPNFRDMDEEDRREAIEVMRQEAAQRQKEQEEKLAEILGPDKMARLNEIYIQAAGVSALQDPSVAEKLDITEEQRNEMREVSQDVMADFRETLQDGDREAMRERMTEMRAEVEKETMAVLSDDQKEKFNEMKGAPFTLSDEDRQALRGGGRGGRGGDAAGGGRGGRGGEGGQRRGRPQSDE
jgi:hypothetical protein